MRQHPCHGCADRESHARTFERFSRLQSETNNLERKISLMKNVIPRTFENVIQVLRQLEYVEGESLTESGLHLTRIFAERDLLVSETLRRGLLSDLAPAEVPAILSGLLFESRSDDKQLPRIPKQFTAKVQEIARIWGELETLEGEYGLATQREPDFSMAWSVYRWSSGTSIARVLRETDITAGDFVRHIKQIIDLLGQLIDADPDHQITYQEALERIDRGLVKMSSVA